MANIIGSGPNQIPTNGSLGKLAFADYLDMSDIPNPFIVSSNNSEALRIKQTGTGNLLYATDGNDNERVYINNAGYLRLTSNTGTPWGGISLKNTYGSANLESINFVDFSNDLGIITGAIFNGNEAYTGGSYISLLTTPNGSRSSDRRVEAMRIDANGNIGIGHSSPSAWYSTPNRLVVNQSANSTTAVGIGNATSGLNAACALKYIGGSSYSYTQCQLSDNNGSPYFAEIHGSGVGFKHWTMNGYERMRLDASTGNFAIGTNDSSNLPAGGILGAVPSGKLHVHAGNLANTAYNALINSRYTCGLEGGNLSIFDIAHYRESTSGTGWLTTSTRMQQRIDWTWMAWQQFNGFGNPSGISWGTGTGSNRQDVPEKMRLDSSGNLGVGTNNPSNWGKFVVAGTSSGGVVVSSIVNVSGTAGTQAVLSFDTTNNGFNVRDCQIRATNDGLNQSTLGFYTSNADTPAERMRITAAGNVGIGTGATVNYKLQVNGSFAATTKSFVIDHPTKPDMKLRYGSLESPYHGVRLTGEGVLVNGNATIELPDYIHGLCKQEGSQVQITNIKHGKVIWVEDIEVDNNKFTVAADVNDDKEYKFYWSFTAIRKDIEDMVVEFENE